jgi:hypothetical protein
MDMNEARRDTPMTGDDTPTWHDARRDFAAPLAGVTRGRLVFERGAANVTLGVQRALEDLCRAHFEGPMPDVRAQGGTVAIRYRYFSFFDWLRYAVLWDAQAADVTLNGSVPWDIEIRGGASRLGADLRELALRSLEIRGGASRVDVSLPMPEGAVPIRIGGGASHVTLLHPPEVGVRLRVGGGASSLTLDDQHIGAIGGGLRLETPGYAGAAARYDVEVGGGVSHLSVEIG